MRGEALLLRRAGSPSVLRRLGFIPGSIATGLTLAYAAKQIDQVGKLFLQAEKKGFTDKIQKVRYDDAPPAQLSSARADHPDARATTHRRPDAACCQQPAAQRPTLCVPLSLCADDHLGLLGRLLGVPLLRDDLVRRRAPRHARLEHEHAAVVLRADPLRLLPRLHLRLAADRLLLRAVAHGQRRRGVGRVPADAVAQREEAALHAAHDPGGASRAPTHAPSQAAAAVQTRTRAAPGHRSPLLSHARARRLPSRRAVPVPGVHDRGGGLGAAAHHHRRLLPRRQEEELHADVRRAAPPSSPSPLSIPSPTHRLLPSLSSLHTTPHHPPTHPPTHPPPPRMALRCRRRNPPPAAHRPAADRSPLRSSPPRLLLLGTGTSFSSR